MKRVFILLALLLIIHSGLALAQTSDRAGSVGALFLKLGMSPRAVAMGNTYIGVSDDLTGVFLNPVSISRLEGIQFFISECEYLVDMRSIAGAVSFPMPEEVGGRIALHYTGFLSGDMTMTTATDIDGTVTNKSFSWNDLAIGVVYARNFTNRFSVGGGIKYVRTDVADFFAQTVAFDIGTLYMTGFRNLRIGMSVTNFGPNMQFNGDYDNTYIRSIYQISVNEEYGDYALPISLQIGVAYDFFFGENMRITGAFDFSHPNDLAERVHLGAEFAYDEMFFVRGGFFMDMDKSDIEDEVNPGDDALDRFMELRFGAGVKVSNVLVDYAWQDIEALGSVHRFAVGFMF